MADLAAAARADEPAIKVTSKSFWLAVQLLPRRLRRDITSFYAWLRYVDDSVDTVAPAEQMGALTRLRQELDQVYGAATPLGNRMLELFRGVARRYEIPIEYPRELLAGMEMDVACTRYRTVSELNLYAYRVAGVVGLMLAHVMGVRDRETLRHAAHLGFGMQMTNICRDVVDDWDLGRMYLPAELLGEAAVQLHPGSGAMPRALAPACAGAVRHLLARGDAYYRSADAGIRALPWRCAFAVRAARLIYAGSARVIRRRNCDVFAGRASLSVGRKLALALRALAATLAESPRRITRTLGRVSRRVPPVEGTPLILRCEDVQNV